MREVEELNSIKSKLNEISNNIDSYCYKLYNSEKSVKDEYVSKYNARLNKYYDETSDFELSKMIQERLPSIMKLFQLKVYIKSKCLDETYSCIRVQYSFDWRPGTDRFCYEFWANDFEQRKTKV